MIGTLTSQSVASPVTNDGAYRMNLICIPPTNTVSEETCDTLTSEGKSSELGGLGCVAGKKCF